jgi:hypothetical protein
LELTMPNEIEIVSTEGKHVGRIVENGEIIEKDFTKLAYARSWASGQSMRLFHTADLKTENLLQAYALSDAPEPNSARSRRVPAAASSVE